MSITVWAPTAQRVRLDLRGEHRELAAGADGWWSGPALRHGQDYGFLLDDDEMVLPDPRAPWQPDGVHAHSRWYDTDSFTWTDADWPGKAATGAVIYELHVGTFTPEGTLDAAIARLPHLAALGVDLVELMPVAAFPGTHGWGYDGVALYAVHEPYGGPAALQRFVDAAHGLGLGVVLDVVYNHLGPSGNYLSRFGPYFTDRHETPWGQAVNLDGADAGPVRAFIVENALRWFADFHIDALRLDAVHELIDDSDQHVLAELSHVTEELSEDLGRPLSLIAESDLNDARMITPVREGGIGMHAQWDDDVHHAIHAVLTGERHGYYADFGSLPTLAKALTKVFVHDGGYSTFRGRPWGVPVEPDTSGHRFVVSINTHDQVGNRALGDRPSASLPPGRLAIGAALLLTSHYTPMLFMGEEWGASTPWMYFTDHAEPELAAAIAQGRQREFGDHGWAQLYGREDLDVPDPQDPQTVAASRLDWTERDDAGHARLLGFYRDLIALRRATPDLLTGDRSSTSVEYDEDAGWFVMHRGGIAVVVNTGPAQDVPVTRAAARPVLLTWELVERTSLRDDAVHLGAETVVLLGSPGPETRRMA